MIYTLGYEGRSLEKFILILKDNSIEILVDVRWTPWSRKEGFSKRKLSETLEGEGIGYQHIKTLGIGSSRRKAVQNDMDHRTLLDEYSDEMVDKVEELNQLKHLAKEGNIALMCYEADVNWCHRGRIGAKLIEDGLDVKDV